MTEREQKEKSKKKSAYRSAKKFQGSQVSSKLMTEDGF